MFKHTTLFHAALLSAVLYNMPAAMAQDASPKALGSAYTPVAAVSAGAASSAAFCEQAATLSDAARTSDRVIDFFIWDTPLD